MSEIIKFKKNTESVCERVNKKCDGGDYISAISILLNEIANNPEVADFYAQIADIYTELGLYENAITYWFKYLKRSRKKFYVEGYNGLGANYYFAGNKQIAGYYFGEQLNCDFDEPCVYDDVLETFRDEILEDIQKEEKRQFYLVKDTSQEEIDGKILEKGKRLNNSGEYELAIETLSEIKDKSPIYGLALAELSFSNFCLDKIDASVELIKRSIKAKNITAKSLTYLINLFFATNEEGVEEYLQMLIDLDATSSDEKYKKLNALCEFYLYDEAMILVDDLLSIDKFDVNTTFIKAFLLYNKELYSEAEKYFRKAYLLSGSPVAYFYLQTAIKATNGEKEYDNLKISFNLPDGVAEEYTDYIKGLTNQTRSFDEYSLKELLLIADWCFNCSSPSLQIALSLAFMSSGDLCFIDYMKDVLINPSVMDEVKSRIVTMFCSYTVESSLSVVYGNKYKIIKVERPDLFEENYGIFAKAYAYAFGKLSIFADKMKRLVQGAEELQLELIHTGKVYDVKNVIPLACAMYFYSGLKTFKDSEFAYQLFDANKQDVINIIKMTE